MQRKQERSRNIIRKAQVRDPLRPPSVIEAEVQRQYNVEVIGRLEAVRERFYAITVNRRLRHPAVIAMSEAAREALFPEARQPGARAAEPTHDTSRHGD